MILHWANVLNDIADNRFQVQASPFLSNTADGHWVIYIKVCTYRLQGGAFIKLLRRDQSWSPIPYVQSENNF